MLPRITLLPLLVPAILASHGSDVLDTDASLESIANDIAVLEKRESSFSAAVVEVTFYAFIDSTEALAGDCAANCAANPTGPFPNPQQGIVAHTCSNPNGSPRTNARGEPTAGGDGTYNNPISAAAATGQSIISQCKPFWSPYLYKWFIFDDLCPSCDIAHFDLFIGGSASDTECPGICDCENSLTPTDGGQYGATKGGAACIFYDISGGDLEDSVYQPTETGGLQNSGHCYSDLNLIDSSTNNADLCEVCVVNTNTCQVGVTNVITSPFKKRAPRQERAVTARAAMPEKTVAPEVPAPASTFSTSPRA
ncbi:hypothetical protein LTS12_017433 [Elasticomyces elasticus]|nr:hypothetical protein LTS12_017433 [Elasticomyces elasticus]